MTQMTENIFFDFGTASEFRGEVLRKQICKSTLHPYAGRFPTARSKVVLLLQFVSICVYVVLYVTFFFSSFNPSVCVEGGGCR